MFKVGDIVRRIGPNHLNVVKGGVYTVLEIVREYGILLKEIKNKEIYDAENFELLEPQRTSERNFDVGDMVVRVGQNHGHCKEGEFYTIYQTTGDGIILAELDDGYPYDPCQFRLVNKDISLRIDSTKKELETIKNSLEKEYCDECEDIYYSIKNDIYYLDIRGYNTLKFTGEFIEAISKIRKKV